ncbi:unnamed protein product [Mesocestoides corti]|uniref:Transposase n=1 Tax=Mesocestoides corti TaxID=53468 RepID=A0A0R3UQS4_MESCO|nr:unnamed protein product [Mesocestoides corti]
MKSLAERNAALQTKLYEPSTGVTETVSKADEWWYKHVQLDPTMTEFYEDDGIEIDDASLLVAMTTSGRLIRSGDNGHLTQEPTVARSFVQLSTFLPGSSHGPSRGDYRSNHDPTGTDVGLATVTV